LEQTLTLKEHAEVNIPFRVDMMAIPYECAKSYIGTTDKCLGWVSSQRTSTYSQKGAARNTKSSPTCT